MEGHFPPLKRRRHTIVKEASSAAMYLMGFGTPETSIHASSYLRMAPIVLHNANTGVVEVLLVSRKKHTEAEWEQTLGRSITLPGVCIQAKELIVDATQGIACAERLLGKIASTSTDVLDAYRILSGGRMHVLDTRIWCMTYRAMADMRADLRALEGKLQTCISERTDVIRLIECTHVVMNAAQALWLSVQALDAERCSLEAREIELVCDINVMSERAAQMRAVLVRQSQYLTARRAGCLK